MGEPPSPPAQPFEMFQFVLRKSVHGVNLMFCLDSGSFDMKASRVQDCAGIDMTKYSHSQTGKIKSKSDISIFDILNPEFRNNRGQKMNIAW